MTQLTTYVLAPPLTTYLRTYSLTALAARECIEDHVNRDKVEWSPVEIGHGAAHLVTRASFRAAHLVRRASFGSRPGLGLGSGPRPGPGPRSQSSEFRLLEFRLLEFRPACVAYASSAHQALL